MLPRFRNVVTIRARPCKFRRGCSRTLHVCAFSRRSPVLVNSTAVNALRRSPAARKTARYLEELRHGRNQKRRRSSRRFRPALERAEARPPGHVRGGRDHRGADGRTGNPPTRPGPDAARIEERSLNNHGTRTRRDPIRTACSRDDDARTSHTYDAPHGHWVGGMGTPTCNDDGHRRGRDRKNGHAAKAAGAPPRRIPDGRRHARDPAVSHYSYRTSIADKETPAPATMAGTGDVDYRTIAVFISVTISAAESARL
jgi:hypothetical protein